ncbi:hypothetical protein [Geobacillus sp. YF-1]|uniref:hypothetical protein n=1 Tax=Geobacillus sp. YF-1 TaxID=3457480 RepID=UPI004045B445
MIDKQQFGSASYKGGCHTCILNYQKILYINSVVRNKCFIHLVVSRIADHGRERTTQFAAEQECGFNIQGVQPMDPFGCIDQLTLKKQMKGEK